MPCHTAWLSVLTNTHHAIRSLPITNYHVSGFCCLFSGRRQEVWKCCFWWYGIRQFSGWWSRVAFLRANSVSHCKSQADLQLLMACSTLYLCWEWYTGRGQSPALGCDTEGNMAPCSHFTTFCFKKITAEAKISDWSVDFLPVSAQP